MLKTFLLFLVLVLAVGGVITLFSRLSSNEGMQKVTSTVKDKAQGALPNSLTQTETGVRELPKELVTESGMTRDEFLSILEASVSAINLKIDNLSKKVSSQPTTTQPVTSTTTTSSSGAKTVYIPIGYGGSGSSSTDFGTVSGHEVTIDPGSYSGYKQMIFEASFRIFQGNGTAEVRLYNKTDGTAILNSNLSTTSQDYVNKTSNGFTIAPGSKTYVVQVKSSTGYSVDLQLTRIKVDF